MDLIGKVKAAVEREERIPPGARIMLGVSGGADSVALLHILHRLGYNVIAAHLNHSIRGEQADADEQFVKDLCADLGVECVTQKTDVPALAKEKGISLEMAAREARHEFFRSLTSDLRPLTSVVCLAHHADDQLETFFLRAARGSGPSGLGGMNSVQELTPRQVCNGVGQGCRSLQSLPRDSKASLSSFESLYSESLCSSQNQKNTCSRREACPTSQGEAMDGFMLLRPMLGIRRSEIFQWLENQGIAWREDASNADQTIPRNLVRHQILPMLGKINERAAENILRTMQILRDEEDHPEKAAARRAARDRLIAFGVSPTFEAVEQFIEFSARTDGTIYLDLEGLRIKNEYGEVNVDATSPSRSIRMEQGVGILRGQWEASVSLVKIDGREVTVRAARPGDRMNPYGMEGSKKLQDIFTDLKIPQQQRAGWPVVECGNEIIWLPGYRIARGWQLSSNEEPALHLFFK